MVKASPRWSARAFAGLTEYALNGIIYLGDEGYMTAALDWKDTLMLGIKDIIQDDQESSFLPIMAEWDLESENDEVMSLAELLQADRADLPAFYVFNSETGQTVKYPEPLVDQTKFSADLIMAWATKTSLKFEIDLYEKTLADIEPGKQATFKMQLEKVLARHRPDYAYNVEKYDMLMKIHYPSHMEEEL